MDIKLAGSFSAPSTIGGEGGGEVPAVQYQDYKIIINQEPFNYYYPAVQTLLQTIRYMRPQ